LIAEVASRINVVCPLFLKSTLVKETRNILMKRVKGPFDNK